MDLVLKEHRIFFMTSKANKLGRVIEVVVDVIIIVMLHILLIVGSLSIFLKMDLLKKKDRLKIDTALQDILFFMTSKEP